MASPALQRGRFSCPNGCYLITTVTSRRARLFEAPESALEMIRWLRSSDDDGRTWSHAWVVMPDHVHWMFQIRETSLETIVRTTKSCAAKAINVLNGTRGAVWQPGYYDQYQRDERQWLSQAKYILENPVRAGLSKSVGEYPHTWCRWP
ncbi:REP-associated tyrosine transposase [Stenotrophomonas sp. AB1(2024)]|uniref:REP-associated tyrosine transposase n=1 Tax=Stenotrophomonas sp. AB1(2024) TaxID=3132215 RepID=UPI0038FB8D92